MPRGTTKQRRPDGQLRFGFMWQSSPTPTTTSKVVADQNPDPLDPAHQISLARAVEEAGFDYVFFADGFVVHGENSALIGHAQPQVCATVFAPVVMAATQHLGVVTTMHTRYLPPGVIARYGASLDALSGGRWGWNIVPGWKPEEAGILGIKGVTDHATRYAITTEAVEAVKQLWAARDQYIEFHGEYHDFEGKLIGPYVEQQPWPCLFNAGVSPAGQELIASTCDYGFTPLPDDYSKVSKIVDGLAGRAEAKGRSPLDINLAGAVGMVLGRTDADAEDKLAWIRDTLDMGSARDITHELMGGSKTYEENYEGEFDELARTIGVSCGSKVLCGSPESVAEQFLDLHRQTGVRGFMVMPCLYDAEQISLLREIFPYLEKAGVWTPPAQREWSW